MKLTALVVTTIASTAFGNVNAEFELVRALSDENKRPSGFNFGSGGGVELKDGTKINFGSGGGAEFERHEMHEARRRSGRHGALKAMLAQSVLWQTVQGEVPLSGRCQLLRLSGNENKCVEFCLDEAVLKHMQLVPQILDGGCATEGFSSVASKYSFDGLPPLIPQMKLTEYRKDSAAKARSLAVSVANLYNSQSAYDDWLEISRNLRAVLFAVDDAGLSGGDDDTEDVASKKDCRTCHVMMPSRKQCLESCVSSAVADLGLIPTGSCAKEGFSELVAEIPQAELHLSDKIFLRHVEIYRRPRDSERDKTLVTALPVVADVAVDSKPQVDSWYALEKWAHTADRYLKHLADEKTAEHFVSDLKKYLRDSNSILPSGLIHDSGEKGCETVSFNLPNKSACVSLCLPHYLADLSMLATAECAGAVESELPVDIELPTNMLSTTASVHATAAVANRNLRSEEVTTKDRIDWSAILKNLKKMSSEAEKMRMDGDVSGFVDTVSTFMATLRPAMDPILKGADSPTLLHLAAEFEGPQCISVEFSQKTIALAGPLLISRAMTFGQCGQNTTKVGDIVVDGSPKLKLKYRVASGGIVMHSEKNLPSIIMEWLKECKAEKDQETKGEALKHCIEEAFAAWVRNNASAAGKSSETPEKVLLPCPSDFSEPVEAVIECFGSVVSSAEKLNVAAPWSQFLSGGSGANFDYNKFVGGSNANQDTQKPSIANFDWKATSDKMMNNPVGGSMNLAHHYVDNQAIYCSHVVCPPNLPYCDYGVCKAEPPSAEVAAMS